jgi:hypothetical protein
VNTRDREKRLQKNIVAVALRVSCSSSFVSLR